MLLVVSRMYKSRFAEHAATAEFHPQLRRFTACSGLRIEVYLRHTRGSVLSSETQQGVIGSQTPPTPALPAFPSSLRWRRRR